MSTRSNWKNAAYPHEVKDTNITAKNATITGLESTDIRVSNIEGKGYLESKKDIVESTGDNYSSSDYAGLTISAEAIRYTGGVQLPDVSVNEVTLEQYMQPISFLNSFDGTEQIHGVIGYASQRKSDDPDSSANISTFGLFGAPGENVVLTVSEQEGGMYNYITDNNQGDFATVKTGIIIDASNRVFMGVNANELYPGGLDLLVKGSENAQLYVKGDIIFEGSGVQVEKYIVDDMFIGSSVAIMGNQLNNVGMENDISLAVPNLENYLEDYEASNISEGYLFVANTTKLFADLNVSGGVTIGSGNNLDNSSHWVSGIETLKINTPFIKDASYVYSGFDSSIYKDGQESDDNLVSRVRHEVYNGKDSLLIQHQDEDGNSSQGSLKFLKTNAGAETVSGDVLGSIQFSGVYNSGTSSDAQYTQFSTASIKSKQTDTSKNNLIITSDNITFDVSGGDGTIYTQGANIDLSGGNIINVNDISGVNNIISSGDLSFNVNSGNGTIYTQGASIYLGDGDISNARLIRAKHIQLYSPDSSNSYIDFGLDDFESRIIYGQDTRILNFSLSNNLNSSARKMLLLDGSNDVITMRSELDLSDNNISNVANLNGITATEISYLEGVTSNIQNQLDEKQDTLVAGLDITTGNILIDEPGETNVTLRMKNSTSADTFRIIYNTVNNFVWFQFFDDGASSAATIMKLKNDQVDLDGNDLSGVKNIIANGSNIFFDVPGTIYTQGANFDVGGGIVDNVSQLNLYDPSNIRQPLIDFATEDDVNYMARIVYNASVTQLRFVFKDASGENEEIKLSIDGNNDVIQITHAYLDLTDNDISNVNNLDVNNIISSGNLNFNVNSGNGTIYTNGANIDLNGGIIENIGEINTNGSNIDLNGGNIENVDTISSSGNLTFNSQGGSIYTNGATIDLSGAFNAFASDSGSVTGGSIVNISQLKSASLPDDSITKIFMVQTVTKGVFRMDNPNNWNDGEGNTSRDTGELTQDGKHRLNGTKSGKTAPDDFGRDDNDTDNGDIVDKYGNGRVIIDYDIQEQENSNKHFWKFGSDAWIDYTTAEDDGKFKIKEPGFYRITANIRAINVTTVNVADGEDIYVNQDMSLGFYISRGSSDDNAAKQTGNHTYWDDGIAGSFGLIHLNGSDFGRCGSTSFSNIYHVTQDNISDGESFCIRTLFSDSESKDYYTSKPDNNRHDSSHKLWGVARDCDDFQTWVQLIFEKIN